MNKPIKSQRDKGAVTQNVTHNFYNLWDAMDEGRAEPPLVWQVRINPLACMT